jgi:hypothetical protein
MIHRLKAARQRFIHESEKQVSQERTNGQSENRVDRHRESGNKYLYPIISKLKDDLELIAVCDPREEAVKAQGRKYDVSAYKDTAEMLEKTRPDICAIVITPSNNHIVGLLCSEHDVSYCTETPIDTDSG